VRVWVATVIRRTTRQCPLTTKIAATLLGAQALLIEAMLVMFVTTAEMAMLGGAIMVGIMFTVCTLVLYGLAVWRLLAGALGGRVFCTIVSAGAFVLWLPQAGWTPKLTAVIALVAIVVSWLPRTSAQSSVGLRSVTTPR